MNKQAQLHQVGEAWVWEFWMACILAQPVAMRGEGGLAAIWPAGENKGQLSWLGSLTAQQGSPLTLTLHNLWENMC